MVQVKGYFSGFARIKNVSVGILYILFTLWLILHTTQYIQDGQQEFWYRVFIFYGLLNALIIGNADLRNKLFNVRMVDFIPRFLLFFGVGMLFFYIMLTYFDPLKYSFFGALANIPLWLGLLHVFVFATTESVIWQGYLDNLLGHPWSELSAGIFHWGIWSGGAIVVIPSATLLFMFFSYVNYRFAKGKNDLSPAIGTHSAWNLIKISLAPLGV
ncbi:MAG: hypothetical protein H7836_12905 [Magnetococcus sp. YQC-3]